jgi:histidinol-phosphatase (PHP family)
MVRPRHTLDRDNTGTVPILYESHTHTVLCRHAVGSADAYCERAIRVGLTGLVFAEHNPMPPNYSHQERLQPALLSSYVAFVERVKHSFADALDVRLGIECDYLPEYESFLTEQTKRHPFDYILGSIHCQFADFRNYASPSDPRHFEAVYYDMLARAAESGLFDALAHPHLCNAVLKTKGALERRTVNLFLDRLAATEVALEINTGGAKFWDPYLYAAAARRGIPVILAGDAHAPAHVGAHFTAALTYLRQVGYQCVTMLLGDQRIDTPIDSALEHLRTATEPDV